MASPIRVADTEVRAQRRRFSAAYKLRILEEAPARSPARLAPGSGGKGCTRRT